MDQEMAKTNRREMLGFGIASVAFPLLTIFNAGCTNKSGTTNNSEADTNTATTNHKKETEITMKIQYLEIVSSDVDALCKQYSTVHGIDFSEPDESLGNARTAKLEGGGLVGIRGPLRESETPVVRPYMLVENIEASVAAAAEAGAEIALPKMEIAGHGTIAIVIQGGIECGLWQL